MASGKFVAYYRVSTDKQGRSGLGLEAQREAVRNYLDGGRWKLIAEYTEVESGKNDERPELQKALHRVKVILDLPGQNVPYQLSKLDRIAGTFQALGCHIRFCLSRVSPASVRKYSRRFSKIRLSFDSLTKCSGGTAAASGPLAISRRDANSSGVRASTGFGIMAV